MPTESPAVPWICQAQAPAARVREFRRCPDQAYGRRALGLDEREPVLIVSTPSVPPAVAPAARSQPSPVGQSQERDRLLSVLASTFRELQHEIRAIADTVARHHAFSFGGP